MTMRNLSSFRTRISLAGMLVAAAFLLGVPTASSEPHAQQPEANVHISAFLFDPPSFTVNAGESVTWMNTDGVPHTSTAAAEHRWGGPMYMGQTFTQTFDEPGQYMYFCEMHPAMVGTINVVGG